MTQTIDFTEWTNNAGHAITVEAEEGRLKGVKILGRESSNGRTYSHDAIAKAVELYEGAKVNVNHPKGNTLAPRDYRDRFGKIENVQVHADGLYGDFRFNPKHALAEQLIWDAAHAPDNVGFSHNVTARATSRKGKTVVEEIMRVHSVDIVADPATTKGLFESEQIEKEGSEMTLDTLTSAQLSESRPDLVEHITKTVTAGIQESDETKAEAERVKVMEAELKTLKEAEEKAKRTAAIDTELKEAKLPEGAVSDLFRSQLESAPDVDARKALIEDRRSFAKPGDQRPESREQGITEEQKTAGDAVTDGKTLAARVRSR